MQHDNAAVSAADAKRRQQLRHRLLVGRVQRKAQARVTRAGADVCHQIELALCLMPWRGGRLGIADPVAQQAIRVLAAMGQP